MQIISPDAIAALEDPSAILVRLDVVDATRGSVLASTEAGAGSVDIEILNGSRLSIDGSADIARTLSLQLNAEELIPTEATDLFHPVAGNEVTLSIGVRTWSADGTSAPTPVDFYWPQGVFAPFDVDIERTTEGITLSVECDDRASHVRDNPWGKPVLFPGGNYADQLSDMLSSRYKNADYSWAVDDDTVPQVLVGLDTRNDPLADMRAVARRAGRRLLVDVQGRFVTRQLPALDIADSVWTFDSSNLERLTRSMSLRETYNAVLLEVESPNPTNGIRGFRVGAFDDRPNSPTRRAGPLGQRTLRERATKAMTVARAQRAVDARLLEVQGLQEERRVTAALNPALEEYDPVTIEDEATGTAGQSLLEQITWNLYERTQEITPKSRQVVS